MVIDAFNIFQLTRRARIGRIMVHFTSWIVTTMMISQASFERWGYVGVRHMLVRELLDRLSASGEGRIDMFRIMVE